MLTWAHWYERGARRAEGGGRPTDPQLGGVVHTATGNEGALGVEADTYDLCEMAAEGV